MIDVPAAPGLTPFLEIIRSVLLNMSIVAFVLLVAALVVRRVLRHKPSARERFQRMPLVLLGAAVVFFALALALTIAGSAFG